MLRTSMSYPLPPRARPLTSEQLRQVFGGCGNILDACTDSYDCCYWWNPPILCKGGICAGSPL